MPIDRDLLAGRRDRAQDRGSRRAPRPGRNRGPARRQRRWRCRPAARCDGKARIRLDRSCALPLEVWTQASRASFWTVSSAVVPVNAAGRRAGGVARAATAATARPAARILPGLVAGLRAPAPRTGRRGCRRGSHRPCPAPPPAVAAAATVPTAMPGWSSPGTSARPSGNQRGSIAIDRPAVSGTPSAPRGPLRRIGDLLLAEEHDARILVAAPRSRAPDASRSHCRRPGRSGLLQVSSPLLDERSGRSRDTADRSRRQRRGAPCCHRSSRTRPEPWICRKNASTGSSTQSSSLPASSLPSASCARSGYGTTRRPCSRPRTRSPFSAGYSSPRSTVTRSSGTPYSGVWNAPPRCREPCSTGS